MEKGELTEREHDRIIAMAWEDRTPFEASKMQFDMSEAKVIKLMTRTLKRRGFILWHNPVNGMSDNRFEKDYLSTLKYDSIFARRTIDLKNILGYKEDAANELKLIKTIFDRIIELSKSVK